jgi:hypothetical protein
MLFWGLVGAGLAKDWPEMREEADRGLPPWIQYYNRVKGEPKLGLFDRHLEEPESSGVKLVGKWGRGPAARVTGRDSLVYLALGSEVAVFNCVNAHNPRIVNEIQCRYVVDRPILKDSILYCVLQGGVEVFNVANPASVTRIKYLPISAVDMCINDTMAYTIDADSFKAYRIVAPDSFQRLGACADSGYYIAADAGFAYLCDRWGLYVIDATDPTNPHQATILTGAQTGAVWVENGYCYYTTASASPNSFRIADVSDPYHPAEVGYIDGIASYDLFKLSYFVYLPGYYIVDVSTPSFPTTVGSTTYGGNGVWTGTPFSYSFIAADYNGLATINITDPVHPALDSVLAGANVAYDVCTDGGFAYVADDYSGMKIVELAPPSNPREVGSYDTAGQAPRAHAVSKRDSFAYLAVWMPGTALRTIDVSVPDNPRFAASRPTATGRACVTRDTLAYLAEDYQLEIFSIANPRNPRLVGSCGLPNSTWGMCLKDSLAFVANLTSLQIVSVANPGLPVVIGVSPVDGVLGVAVSDTIAYAAGYSGLTSVSVANPVAPYVISNLSFQETCVDVTLNGTLAFVGTANSPYPSRLRVVDISDPASMRGIGYYITPDWVRRVFRQDSLIYAACVSGGVCIFETTSTSSVAEAGPTAPRPQAFELTPNPASNFVEIRLEVNQNTNTRNTVRLYDAVGRVVLDIPFVPDRGKQPRSQRVDISALPDGCYFVSVEPSGQGRLQKVVKTGRRR